ncbi:cytochrome P450 family protein [Nocardia callitridis]|uniref:Cytochrome P450 n=1 Tax=Nocardia callitridis TaxID=648753 RepID=A0ABP9K525_9NOCA
MPFSGTIDDFATDPYSIYRAMNAQAPLTAIGPTDFIVTDPALVLEIFADHEKFTSVHNLEGQVPIYEGAQEILRDTLFYRGALFNEAPPAHSAFRKTFIRPFTPTAVEKLVPKIRELAEGMCGDLGARTSFDVMRELAYPLPVTIISDMLGIPEDDRTQVKQWNDLWLALQAAPLPPEAQVQAAEATRAYEDYVRDLIAEIRAQRRPSLILEMADAIDTPGAVHEVDDIIVAIRVMIAAGHETTSGLIGNAVSRLIETNRWSHLAETPAAIPEFVEETLAADPSVQSAPRSVDQEIDLHGITIPSGARLYLAIGAYGALSGRRAPGPDPNAQSHPHIGFGHGIHRCVGSHLGRIEARVALEVLLAAVPAMPRLDHARPPERTPGGFVFRSFSSLPICW